MRRLSFLMLATALSCAPIQLGAQETSSRSPLTAEQLTEVLKASGVPAKPADITLPLPLSSSVAAPHLAITGVTLVRNTTLRIRIACRVAGECLPFFALLELGNHGDALTAQKLLNSSSSPSLPITPVSTPVIHAGEHALLLLEDHHMQIRMPVITIDTGRVGAEIRVASLDRKQTYRGVVVEAGVVHGDLP